MVRNAEETSKGRTAKEPFTGSFFRWENTTTNHVWIAVGTLNSAQVKAPAMNGRQKQFESSIMPFIM